MGTRNGGGGERRLALTVREAAAALGVGKDAVYNAINRGELRSVRLGGTLLVPVIELERLLGIDEPEPVALADVVRELAQLLGVYEESSPLGALNGGRRRAGMEDRAAPR